MSREHDITLRQHPNGEWSVRDGDAAIPQLYPTAQAAIAALTASPQAAPYRYEVKWRDGVTTYPEARGFDAAKCAEDGHTVTTLYRASPQAAPEGDAVEVEAVAKVVKDGDAFTVDWLVEGGIYAVGSDGECFLYAVEMPAPQDGHATLYATPQRAPGVDEVLARVRRLAHHAHEMGDERVVLLVVAERAIREAALASGPSGVDGCQHEWVDASNRYVQSGELCLKCHAIRAAQDQGEGNG